MSDFINKSNINLSLWNIDTLHDKSQFFLCVLLYILSEDYDLENYEKINQQLKQNLGNEDYDHLINNQDTWFADIIIGTQHILDQYFLRRDYCSGYENSPKKSDKKHPVWTITSVLNYLLKKYPQWTENKSMNIELKNGNTIIIMNGKYTITGPNIISDLTSEFWNEFFNRVFQWDK